VIVDWIFHDPLSRDDSEIEPAVNDLKWVLWNTLGYRDKKPGQTSL